MANATLTWIDSVTLGATYQIQWMLNNSQAATQTLPAGTTSADFMTANPGVTLASGDIVGAAIEAVDANGDDSVPVSPASVTIPNAPPPVVQPPTNVQLTADA